MDNNGWAGKPGVPLNPERDGWHWLVCPLKHDVFPRFWRAAGEAQNCRWTAKWLYSRNDWNPKECTYLGPCLTPDEMDARVKEARREALEGCIAASEAVVHLYRVELPEKWKDKPGGISHEWKQAWENNAEIAENMIADIRALYDTPPGMVLVPRKPTDAMIHAGGYALQEHAAMTMEAARIAWDAMLKAAEKGKGNE